MDNNTATLLKAIADKLGTTTQYLWGILLRQAPIDATITLIQISLVLIFGVVLWKIHKRLMKEDKNGENQYYKSDDMAAIPMIFAAVGLVILLICSVVAIGSVINGFFHPEYWALHEILKACKE
jgi:nitrogen fixation/metabolism regulation signal transduction histidine kinase